MDCPSPVEIKHLHTLQLADDGVLQGSSYAALNHHLRPGEDMSLRHFCMSPEYCSYWSSG